MPPDSSDEVVTNLIAPAQTPVEAVLEAVANLLNSDTLELDPLYGPIDPDALNALLRPSRELRIEFKYSECLVEVTGNGVVTANLVTENS